MNQSSSAFSDSKKHYEILDGLRGVAAVVVVMFHILETFTLGDHSKQIINHGYLAVDFFFVLSGFVIGYAYDDRWNSMSIGSFFKRRLIRLHPMIIVGMIIGAVLFYFQQCEFAPVISQTPIWKMLLILLIGITLLPVPLSMDIRGWTEMHPLNGPAWSLFYEYIANILYALFIRKFSKTVLTLFVLLFGAALIHFAVTNANGDVIGGWALEPQQIRVGLTRLLYPFFAGLLMSRICKPGHINNAFLWCSILLVIVLALPRIGNKDQLWMNGLYDALSIIFIFPLIVYIGASGKLNGSMSSKLNRFLGDISYPLYIIHYPFIYTFVAWVANHHMDYLKNPTANIPAAIIIAALIVLVSSIGLAYACVKLYDVPVRKWLTGKLMGEKKN